MTENLEKKAQQFMLWAQGDKLEAINNCMHHDNIDNDDKIYIINEIRALDVKNYAFKGHVFISCSVSDVIGAIEDCEDVTPLLHSITLHQIDELLEHCHRKDYTFFTDGDAIDIYELESLATDYFNNQ